MTDTTLWIEAVHDRAPDVDTGNAVVFDRTRKDEHVRIRRQAMVDLRRKGWTLPRIAKASGYHHTSVLYHLNVAALEDLETA